MERATTIASFFPLYELICSSSATTSRFFIPYVSSRSRLCTVINSLKVELWLYLDKTSDILRSTLTIKIQCLHSEWVNLVWKLFCECTLERCFFRNNFIVNISFKKWVYINFLYCFLYFFQFFILVFDWQAIPYWFTTWCFFVVVFLACF